MQEDKYDLVFAGELVKGFELAQVKRNLQGLFRIDAQKVEKLFSGAEVVLKKGVGSEAANKYRVAMKKAGAVVILVLNTDSADQPSSASVSTQVDKSEPASVRAQSALETTPGAQPARSEPRPHSIDAPEYDLAGVGDDILQPHERARIEPVEVDISALSLAEQNGNLVSVHELQRPEPVKVDIPDIDVAPLGSDVLKEEERVKVEPVKMDLDALSVAEPGERLSEPEQSSPPAPNVDHIRLAD